MPILSVTVSQEHGTVVLRPSGEIDHESAPALAGSVREAEGDWQGLVVDLSRVSFMDSAGLHALVALERRCRERGGHLVLTGVRDQPARLLDLVGLTEAFTIVG
ncbi:STAS domain-containing protein [Streptomyces sp. URMC 125]|uniref:STAS domain-containing protein n=1 Tax=Streptomyces sp. URMC 125 TaxID=3423419 RepID=UPI003F1AB659